jgi:ComF family protein
MCRRIEPPFARAVAYGSYESELRELIHLLKYGGVKPAAKVLGGLLAEAVAAIKSELAAGPIAVIPVPLHRRKLRQRGFNQAELIARAAAKIAASGDRLRLCPGVLVRQRETISQTGLTRHQRRANLRGAFAVAQPNVVQGREVLLVDDVYTTGATLSECARVLSRAGAAKVWVATVARTLKISAQKFEIASNDLDIEVSEVARAEEALMAKAVGT